MQVVKYANIDKRLMYYWSKLYTGEIHAGEDYNKLNKTIVIMIADFELDIAKHIPKFHTRWQIREEEYSKTVLTDVLEINIIELPKLEKLRKNKKEDIKLKLWTKFILSPEEIGDEEMSKNEEIKKAKEELDKINQDEHEKELARLRLKFIMDQKAIKEYGYQEGRQEGIKAGLEEGLQQGLQQGTQSEKNKIAKSLLKIGMPIEQIAKVTELSINEINKLNH